MRSAGSAPHRISESWNLAVWSPDGRLLLTQTKIVDIATGASVDIGQERMIDATFAPDGRSIIYRTFDQGKGTISMIDVDGTNRRKLSESCCMFAVSPLSK
jgi:Tol biopolymer transport system component